MRGGDVVNVSVAVSDSITPEWKLEVEKGEFGTWTFTQRRGKHPPTTVVLTDVTVAFLMEWMADHARDATNGTVADSVNEDAMEAGGRGAGPDTANSALTITSTGEP